MAYIRKIIQNYLTDNTENAPQKTYKSDKEFYKSAYIQRSGLDHSIPLSIIYKTNVFASFEMVHRLLLEDLQYEADKPEL